tara:strand:+ start:10003 stop:11007 length:1005 start_codon:yes stop_codon:yes gene_type:complete
MSFKRLDQEDISISAESIVAPLWSTDQKVLETFFTSSGQVAANTGNYYYEVYQNNPALDVAAASVQFDLAYGEKTGLGSAPYNAGVPTKTPTSTIYGQYRTLIYGDEDTDFVFGTYQSDSIYIFNAERARYKEKLFPGSLNLILSSSTGTLHLTDNSKDTTTISYVDAGRIYDIVSGSDGAAYSGTGFTPSLGSYGKFLPDIGVVVLNGDALDGSAPNGIDLGTSTLTTANNIEKLYNVIDTGASISLQSEETISSNFVFVRVRNSEFNYSTNPSNITGSGELRWDVMINTPQSYITTVGMYNDNNDLLAVAKLSRPLLKDFTKEALVRIKLDY